MRYTKDGPRLSLRSAGMTTEAIHMPFAGINHLAILIAAIVGWLGGAVWYTALAKPWIAAQGKTVEQHKAELAAKTGLAKFAPFILAFVADFVMAWVLAGMVGHL